MAYVERNVQPYVVASQSDLWLPDNKGPILWHSSPRLEEQIVNNSTLVKI